MKLCYCAFSGLSGYSGIQFGTAYRYPLLYNVVASCHECVKLMWHHENVNFLHMYVFSDAQYVV
jgi:hypothetical protein